MQTSPGDASKVTIEDNSVHDYQKNGITGNEIGTMVAIQANTVTGIGPTPGAAQNGIQVGFGAKGSVEGNSVADNVWSTCVSLQQCQFNATGILVFQSDGVVVGNNEVGTNQVGVFIGGQDSKVDRNRVFNSQVLVGIELAGDNNETSPRPREHHHRGGNRDLQSVWFHRKRVIAQFVFCNTHSRAGPRSANKRSSIAGAIKVA